MTKEIEKKLMNLEPRDWRVLKYLWGNNHKCEDTTMQICSTCNMSLCKSCYTTHVASEHPNASHLMQKITDGSMILAPFNEKENRKEVGPKRVGITSKGRVKCPKCRDDTFRSPGRHEVHMLKHEKGAKQDAYREKDKGLDYLDSLTKEELEQLVKMIAASQQKD